MMKKVAGMVTAILIFSIISWFYLLKEPVVFAPSWRVGQSWEVQVFSRVPGEQSGGFYHNIWRFRVADKKIVGGQTIFEIEAHEEKRKKGISYRFEVTHPDLVLKKMSVYKNKKLDRIEKPASEAFFIDPDAQSLVPLDFSPLPTFGIARADKKKALKIGSTEVFADVIQNATMTQEIVIDEPVRKVTVVTKQDMSNGSRIENVQLWEESRPWWSGASRFRNGVKESEAILVKW